MSCTTLAREVVARNQLENNGRSTCTPPRAPLCKIGRVSKLRGRTRRFSFGRRVLTGPACQADLSVKLGENRARPELRSVWLCEFRVKNTLLERVRVCEFCLVVVSSEIDCLVEPAIQCLASSSSMLRRRSSIDKNVEFLSKSCSIFLLFCLLCELIYQMRIGMQFYYKYHTSIYCHVCAMSSAWSWCDRNHQLAHHPSLIRVWCECRRRRVWCVWIPSETLNNSPPCATNGVTCCHSACNDN